MKQLFRIIFFLILTAQLSLTGQVLNIEALLNLSETQEQIALERKAKAIEFAIQNNIPVTIEADGKFMEIQFIDDSGNPQYFVTHNAVSAKSISTDKVYSGGGAGLDLDGNGILVHQWDAGSVRATHQEFDGRASNGDAKAPHWHSTHVAGTIMASGVNTNAKGMAFDAELIAFDWDEFNAEMAEEAASGAIISNHSYGWLRGWEGGNTWWGDPDISDQEDYRFGFYDESARIWDSIVYSAPNFLIVKSAGNDRNDKGDGTYPDDGPYDCIDQLGIAKNNFVVAAVGDIPGGYTQPSDVKMSSFSSWGPADDGRIKPDISANGIGLFSTDSGSDDDYRNLSGTSMSAPSVAGSVALLQQHYENLNGQYMTAASAKALIIHTADEAGTADGPDYEFGWGLMNTKSAALKISEADTNDAIREETLFDGDSLQFSFTASDTNAIKVTIVWTDPPGTPPPPSLDPADTILVNDLDLRIFEVDSETTYFPWKLDKDNPSLAATNDTENDIDNVEMVYIPNPDSGTIYTITIDHDGVLQSGSQDFSLVLTFNGENILAPQIDFIADNTTPTLTDTVNFTDLSSNSPTGWDWSFDPDDVTFLSGTGANSQNPVLKFDSFGLYNVTLTSSNVGGSNSETKLDYIQVFEILSVDVSAFPEEICTGDSSQLTAQPTGGTDSYQFSWTSNPPGFFSDEQNPVVFADATTTFIVEVDDGYQTTVDSVTIYVNQLPEIMLGNWPEELCNEDEPPVQLTAEPEGGVFSGEAVSPEGIFTPEGAPTGWNLVTYTFQDENNCINSAADSIYVDDCVGLSDLQAFENSINIYPVPNSGRFTIESARIIDQVEIVNTFGIVIYSANATDQRIEIDIPLSTGIYLVKVFSGRQVVLKSIAVR